MHTHTCAALNRAQLAPAPAMSARLVKVGNYRVGSVIGSGSFGSVRYALDEGGAPVAIKVIDKKEVLRGGIAEVERASREFFILTSLDHKNVIRLTEVSVGVGCAGVDVAHKAAGDGARLSSTSSATHSTRLYLSSFFASSRRCFKMKLVSI